MKLQTPTTEILTLAPKRTWPGSNAYVPPAERTMYKHVWTKMAEERRFESRPRGALSVPIGWLLLVIGVSIAMIFLTSGPR